MATASRRTPVGRVAPEHIDAVMRASRAFVGIAAASIAAVDDVVTVPQLRVLVMVSTRGPLNMLAVAEALDVSPSNASRICDRLMKAGLLDRREDAEDRRHVTLSLTGDGRALVNRVTKHRRSAVRRVLRKMSLAERARLTQALNEFADAAGEPDGDDLTTPVGARAI
jgi:DNA-binding MarR family transcriptional regulator